MTWSRMVWPAYREYVLPGRSDAAFWAEGEAQAALLQPLIGDDAVILDFGCGPGRVSRYLSGSRVLGVDVSVDFLREAVVHGIEPIVFNGNTIRLPTDYVDYAFSIMVFQHINRDVIPIIVDELRRVLKPSGGSWLQFPRDGGYYDAEYVFTEADMESLGLTFVPGSLYKYADGFHHDREWIASL